jgi:hypothetical protein
MGWRIIKSTTPFIPLVRRSPDYAQGYRAATKACTTWLMNVAEERGKHARPVLRKAAADMSREAKDIAWEGDEAMEEGPMFDALQQLRDEMRGKA